MVAERSTFRRRRMGCRTCRIGLRTAAVMKIICDRHNREMVYNTILSWHKCPADRCWKVITDEEIERLTSQRVPEEIRVT